VWVYVGLAWEQKQVDGKLMGTMGTYQNKRILMGY